MKKIDSHLWKAFLLKLLLIFNLVYFLPVIGFTQTSSQASQQNLFPSQPNDRPEPYQPEEFHPTLRFIRRASIIATGTFPFVFLGVSAVYDLGRFAYFGISSNPQTADYLPLFFAPPNKPPNSQSENLFILLSSVGISMVLGIVDGFLDRRNEERRMNE